MTARSHLAVRTGLLAVLGVLTVLPGARAQEASFMGLGNLPGGGFDSKAYSVAANGTGVVGESVSTDGDEAFYWSESGGMVGLGDLEGGAFGSKARFISSDGTTVVGESLSANGTEAFFWEAPGGSLKSLGDLPGGLFFSRALSASADGSVIVGEGNSAYGFEAFRWEADVMTGLGDLPGGFFYSQAHAVSADGRVVGGVSQSGKGAEAFRWTEAEGMVGLGDLRGGTYFSVVYSASASGDVLAGWGQSESGIEAFRWENGVMEGLGDLPGSFFFSVALSTSSDGSAIVGYSEAEPQGYRAFLWTESSGMRNLKDVLEADYGLDLTGWTLRLAYDISDDGTTIVGYGTNPMGQTEAWRASGLQLIVRAESAPSRSSLALSSSPNPARTSARLSFSLPAPGDFVLDVFDVLGRRIASARGTAGVDEHAVDLSTSGWPAGQYVARVRAGRHSDQHTFTVTQ